MPSGPGDLKEDIPNRADFTSAAVKGSVSMEFISMVTRVGIEAIASSMTGFAG
ncbi:UNVERIFIED_CONTAM: hypothetical protein Sradi_5090100 [Sesamum radiatum]|uniref:Uncharacterized protein n=1 Tax=Sesamum radiatum TaxID=300843 RepID=A0AAW2M3N3_SESRA